ncbi:MAG: glutathionylspermidine synthase family protein [Hafnia sp.]
MQRFKVQERENWQAQAESIGFKFHTIDNERYWDERYYYQFSASQIENHLEDPTKEIHEMCMEVASRAVKSDELLSKLDIPEGYWDQIEHSWKAGHPHLYGRMDFSYDGNSPAKLLELNYDTPTSLFEGSVMQWLWLEEMIKLGRVPANADQFNSIHEKFMQVFASLDKLPSPLYFSSVKESEEDRGTVDYIADIATACGITTKWIGVEDIGLDPSGQFIDLENNKIPALFKLYPWEHMFRERFGPGIPFSDTLFIEPTWKSILSNKGILPILWEMFPNHPNLLETHFLKDTQAAVGPGWVKKPFFSREGSNIEIQTLDGKNVKVDGPYTDSPHIIQKFHALPKFGDSYTLIGSWVVGDEPAGIGIREDDSLITKDSSRFVPHIFVD